jgi:hypothetical protein
MADIDYPVLAGTKKRLIDMGDGSFAERVYAHTRPKWRVEPFKWSQIGRLARSSAAITRSSGGWYGTIEGGAAKSWAVAKLVTGGDAPNTNGVSCVLTWRCTGRVAGIQYSWQSANPVPDFDIVVDNIPYKFASLFALDYGGQINPTVNLDNYACAVIDNLPDGEHIVSLHPVNISGTSQTLYALGMVVEDNGLYPSLSTLVSATAMAAVPTTAGFIAKPTDEMRGMVGLNFISSDAGAQTVAISGADGTTVYAVISVPANGSAQWLPAGGRPFAIDLSNGIAQWKLVSTSANLKYSVLYEGV